MPTEKKIEIVKELQDRIERCAIAIAVSYRGLRVTESNELRRVMHEADVELRVVKNRLFMLAARQANRPEMAELADGPTAIVFGYDDVVAPAKAAVEYERTAKNDFSVRMGVLDSQVLSLAEVKDLAALPPREVLLAQVAGALQSPVTRLAGLLSALLANPAGRLLNDSVSTFSGLLEARAKQLEGA